MTTNLVTRNTKRTKKDNNLLRLLFQETQLDKTNAGEDFLCIINKAKEDVYDAENFFNNVTDPELIDHAIYKMEAAKSRYAFLIKKAKNKGVCVEI